MDKKDAENVDYQTVAFCCKLIDCIEQKTNVCVRRVQMQWWMVIDSFVLPGLEFGKQNKILLESGPQVPCGGFRACKPRTVK